MRVHVCASPAGSAIHHTPTNLFILYKYKKLDWGCGCLGYAVVESEIIRLLFPLYRGEYN